MHAKQRKTMAEQAKVLEIVTFRRKGGGVQRGGGGENGHA